ncbi:MAG: sporulation protein YqfD [Oscillospiraceae bacterium]
MIIIKIIRYFSGKVHFQVRNGFSERLINLCSANNVLMWEFEKTQEGFCATVAAKDYKYVKKFAKKANVETSIVSKHGFMFKANKYKNRWGIVIGVLTFIIFTCLMQCFVWEIEIIGNDKVKTSVILSELEQIGVHKFSFIPNIDFRMKKQEALINIPQLSWLTINHRGCKLSVKVTERALAPLIRENVPCDIVASKTGQIRYMEVYNGTKVIGENYTVAKGDKIVSGMFTNKAGKISYIHSDAKVIAEVQLEKTLSVDIVQLSKEYTGKTKTRNYLNIFSFKLPLFIATKLDGTSDVTAQDNSMVLFDKRLPIGIYSLHYNFYNKKPQKLSEKDAKEVLDNCFLQYEATELKDCAIIGRTKTQTLTNSVLRINISYIVEEDIAKKMPIIIE